MRIKAKLKYAYQREELVTIINTSIDEDGEPLVVFVDEWGKIRVTAADWITVVDTDYLPTE